MNGATGAISGVRLWLSSADRKEELKAEFERVALPQLSHLYASAFYLTKDKTEAEDLVQETYLRAFRFFDKFQPGTNFRAWLLSILRNLFINRYRQIRRDDGNGIMRQLSLRQGIQGFIFSVILGLYAFFDYCDPLKGR